jgi:GNAT superfamily N-acetyltransferase
MRPTFFFVFNFFEKWILFKITLEKKALPQLPGDLFFEKIALPLAVDEWKLLLHERGEEYLQILNKRLSCAERYAGFALKERFSGKVVFSAWVRFKPFFDDKMKIEIRLSDHDAFFYDAFCIPAYRERGLHHFMLLKRMEYCLDRGYRFAFTIASSRNRSSLCNIHRLGFIRTKSRVRWNTKWIKNILRIGNAV